MLQAHIEPFGKAQRELVETVGEHHLVTVHGVIVQTVGVEERGMYPVLLLRAMQQKLPHPLGAVGIPTQTDKCRLDCILIGAPYFRFGNCVGQVPIGLANVIGKGVNIRLAQALAVR